jgi:amidase
MIYAPPGVPRIDRIFSAAGPLARTASDIALLFRVLAGADARDPDVPPVPVLAEPRRELGGLSIAVAPSIPGIRIAREITERVAELGVRLAEHGARVEEALPTPFEELLAAFRRLFRLTLASAMKAGLAPANRENPAGPSPYDAIVAMEERDRFIVTLSRFFERYDVFISPAAICTAFPHGPPRSSVDVDGEPSPSTCIDHPTILSTYTGTPSLVVPLALGAHGLPIGAQLLGPRFSDERLIAIGEAIAEAVGPLPPPSLPAAP